MKNDRPQATQTTRRLTLMVAFTVALLQPIAAARTPQP
jgi:hypothetical protein